jgi:integrase
MLNNTRINSLKPTDKMYRVADNGGLAIEIKPSGSKIWRYRCRINNLATMMTIGHYPQVSLAEARRARDELKHKIKSGIDPREVVEEVVIQINTFKSVYDEWFNHNLDSWTPAYAKDVNERCTNHLLPYLSSKPIDTIMPKDMLDLFKFIEANGRLNMLKKVRGYASRVFRYAVGIGYCSLDPTRDLPSDVFKKEKPVAYSHVTDPKQLGVILRKIDVYHGSYSVSMALKIAPHVFLRPSELVSLEWDDIDFEQRLIRVKAPRMKMRRAHLVPMSEQVFRTLRLCMKDSFEQNHVFRGPRNGLAHITPDSLRVALRKLNITSDELTTHGFRHIASTLLNEQGWPPDAIEKQLAHEDRNKVRAVYNQAEYLDVRRKMMQAWSDYLDSLL